MNRSRTPWILALSLCLVPATWAQFGLGPELPVLGPPSTRASVLAVTAPRETAQAYLERFAPVIRQDTADDGDDGAKDWITALDFDGDWILDNSWESQGERDGDRLRHAPLATVYTGAVFTETHAFLTYAWFHPRDWSAGVTGNHWLRNVVEKVSFGKIPHSAHENDLEGALLVVDLERQEVVVVETIYHSLFQKYWRDPHVQPTGDGEGFNGAFRADEEGRPILMVQSHGHGVQAWDGKPFPGKHDDGVVYLPGAEAGNPEDYEEVGEAARFEADRGGRVRQVPYAMVPLEEELWPRALARDGEMFGEFGDLDGLLDVRVGWAFKGDDYGTNKANAPWGWTDKTTDTGKGHLFLDPAGTVAAHFDFSDEFSRRYRYHPYRAEPQS